MAEITGDFREGAKISVLYSKTQETVFATSSARFTAYDDA
jgi:hypothetical protein